MSFCVERIHFCLFDRIHREMEWTNCVDVNECNRFRRLSYLTVSIDKLIPIIHAVHLRVISLALDLPCDRAQCGGKATVSQPAADDMRIWQSLNNRTFALAESDK